MFINLKKILKFGAQNFARNFWLAILTISILSMLLFSINVLVIMNFLTDEASRQMKSKVDVTVYLKPDTVDSDAQNLRAYLVGLPSVSSAVYTDAKSTLADFKEKHKNNPEILSSLGILEKNPFGGYIVVQTVNVNDYKSVLAQLESKVYKSIIENKDFDDHEKLVNVINDLTGRIKQFIILISLIFAFIAAVIIFNTIKIAIYTHRDEIAIMNLVGASRYFVAGQFVFEAVLYSLISTVLIFIAIFPLISAVQPRVIAFFNNQGGDIFGYYRLRALPLFATEFLIVAALSASSAALAIGRYLKK